MEQLILENENLIYSITKYFEKYSNKEDLFQAGCVGMMLAYKNYKDDMNTKFTTYAYPYILGEMRKLVREDKTLKIGRSLQKINLQIEKANILLTQKLMRNPSLNELADYLELPLYLVEEAINSTIPVSSIDVPILTDGKEVTLHDIVSDNKKNNLEDLISLREALTNLNEEEKNLIEKRYMEDYTQQEIANQFGISQVQVSRNEKKILTKLNSYLKS